MNVSGGNPIGEYVLAIGLDEEGEAYVATKTALSAGGTPGGAATGSIYRIRVVPEPATYWLLLALCGITMGCVRQT